ncbi:TonB-dependent receptor [Chitinophaga sp.]|uniref:SusC/RagA family TonB-linked outer membrane protein n=1 Tax=Chitinophaga sp. TaxID=1869181 RepID=UPI0031DB1F7C
MKTAYKIHDFVAASWGIRSILLIAMLLTGTMTIAQTNSHLLEGRISTAGKDEPLPGASVRVKGTNNGAISDINGRFHLQVKDEDSLEVTLMGFDKQVVAVKGQTSIRIQLTEGTKTIEEIVVVGYGTEKKKLVTGAIDHVNTKQLEENHSLRVDQALQGQTPGVQIATVSAQPGEAMKVRIRGTGTVGSADPIYIIDGVPIQDISYLNPSDIAGVDVLKDAASSAIYGSRAANGVVLITTTKGKNANTKLAYDAYYGVQNPTHKTALLNAHDYGVIMNEMAINSGNSPYFTTQQLSALGKGTDWQEAMYNKKAPMMNHSVSLSGGNDRSVYSSSVSYTKQDGIIGFKGQSRYERVNFRLNSEHKAYKDLLVFGENLTYSRSAKSGVGVSNIYDNSMHGVLNVSPLFPVYDSTGAFGKSTWNVGETNPVAAMYYKYQNKNTYDRVIGNTYLQATPIKGLNIRTDFGINLMYTNTNSYKPVYDLSTTEYNIHSQANQGMERDAVWNWDNTINYQRQFGKHNINALVGMNSMESTTFFVNGYKQDLTKTGLDNAIINNGTTDSTQKVYGSKGSSALLSYFGRIGYNYAEKYMFTAIFRIDGSTAFGANNRYGHFPSFSAGWVPTNEPFLKKYWLDFLKIRAGWGQNGNLPSAQYQYLSTLSTQYLGYYFGSGDVAYVGAAPTKTANPDLKWETSEQTNFGIDAVIFKDFSITVDVYNKMTKDWLVSVNTPAISGANTALVNGGDVRNRGIEAALGWDHKFHELSVGVNANLTVNRNKVTDIPNKEKIINGSTGVTYASMPEFYRAQKGFPMGYFYGYKTDGIFQNTAEIAAYKGKDGTPIQPNAQPGDVRFQDLNGDGVINASDETMIGNPFPKFTYGFNVNLGYKGFDLTVAIYGSQGSKIWDGTHDFSSPLSNYSTEILGRWTGEGTSNKIPRITDGAELNQNWIRSSDLYVKDGSFLRIKSVNLGYDFKKLFPQMPIQQLRLYVSGTNLFTFTKYKGIDPEIGYGPSSWASGIDVGTYPQPKTLLVGLNVKF